MKTTKISLDDFLQKLNCKIEEAIDMQGGVYQIEQLNCLFYVLTRNSYKYQNWGVRENIIRKLQEQSTEWFLVLVSENPQPNYFLTENNVNQIIKSEEWKISDGNYKTTVSSLTNNYKYNTIEDLKDKINKQCGTPIEKTAHSGVPKYANDNFESKKEFEKYRANKKKLKGFAAAEKFLLRLETIDSGFYISPRTNLHCYYKDRYLFYLHDFSKFSIKIRQQFNQQINKGTYDCSASFFDILKSMLSSNDKGISMTEGSYEIGNSENADIFFNIICDAMQYIARKIDQNLKEEQEEVFEKEVAKARKLTQEERLKKLKNYPDYPSTSEKKTVTFNRNPYMVAEVLERANGKCEFCKQVAPFNRVSDGTPFLEVHHILSLSDGGKDIVNNAIALCPNCHRGAHYGGYEMKKITNASR